MYYYYNIIILCAHIIHLNSIFLYIKNTDFLCFSHEKKKKPQKIIQTGCYVVFRKRRKNKAKWIN
jgi:hypothetical protein